MTDCTNVEIRELLPEYLGGTLSDARRREVSEHIATCQACTDELALLALVREAYTEATPAVNVSAIVAALPKKAPRPAIRSWRRTQAFQIAAAASFIALGGISLAVARSFFNGGSTVAQIDTAVVPNSTSVNAEAPAISFAGGVSDLGDEDLEALLTALETIEALPVTETSDPPLTGSGRQGS
jgi:anti-sigma factor RsiW